ncbi:MAG: hypothetical protein FWD38_07475 [Oscillospiraceae bacterium]|nr:hypothetical protein [Oscillospiraceae bacterium]
MIVLTIIAGGYFFYHFNSELEIYSRSTSDADVFFTNHIPQPFINSAVNSEPYRSDYKRDDALFFYDTPEGFTMISHSPAWDENMLELLYYELLMNEHGDEINALYEVIVYPYEEEEGVAAAMYSPGTTAVSFFIEFPALPADFTIDFPQDIGSITLFNGDNNTTIESMASSLSHEYGHHYTFYYMFGFGQNEPDSYGHNTDDSDSLADTVYARLRNAEGNNLITSTTPGETYHHYWYRYLIEVAAEDYVQLMGSRTTRQIIDFIDVRQAVGGAEQPEISVRPRNAFPQANMLIPLAGDVPGLNEYYYSFIDASPRVPAEEKQEITLQINRNSTEYHLTSGLRTFVHYSVTWNAPYQNAVYTLVYYDPIGYDGWGVPVRTVRPGQNPSAIIGEYVTQRGNQIVSMDDGITSGRKVFFVVALLPDGSFYLSEKLEFQF